MLYLCILLNVEKILYNIKNQKNEEGFIFC